MEELLNLNDEQFMKVLEKLNYEELEILTKNIIIKTNKESGK